MNKPMLHATWMDLKHNVEQKKVQKDSQHMISSEFPKQAKPVNGVRKLRSGHLWAEVK